MSRPLSVVSSAVLWFLVFASMGLMGCATLIHGTSQEVTVESTPTEAQVEVDGRPVGETPTTTVLKRDREYTVSIYREGHEPHRTTLRPRRNIWATVNILNLVVPGLLIDASTGALYSLEPGTIAPELQPVTPNAAEPSAPDQEEGGTP